MATQSPPTQGQPLAIVTGASSGIGRELALIAAREGFDLIVAADTPLDSVVAELQAVGAQVDAVQEDLATQEGIDRVVEAIRGRPVARSSIARWRSREPLATEPRRAVIGFRVRIPSGQTMP